MANYKAIAQQYPSTLPYLRARIWAREGGILIYRPSQTTIAFSTDAFGFRRSTFEGETTSVERKSSLDKYSLVLGSSHVFGFGLPGNNATFASTFAARLGHPVLNLCLPEANTGDLVKSLETHIDPAKVDRAILFPGGSFTRFCYSGVSSPIDGPPGPQASAEASFENADAPQMLENLVRYQMRHIARMAEIFAAADVPFYVVDDLTFFEKSEPTEVERLNGLGTPAAPQGQPRFDRHRRTIGTYREGLFPQLAGKDIRVLDFGGVDDIDFIDEFHYNAQSIGMIVDRLVPQMA